MSVLARNVSNRLARARGGTQVKTIERWLRDLQDDITLGDVAGTFTSGDATPSVLDNSKFITAGSTAITNFDDGVEGQVIRIFRGDADIAITDNANIDPIISGNLTLSATRPSAAFRLTSGVWKQVEESGAVSTAMTPVMQAATLAAARDALGVEIGVDVQAYSANLATWAGIAPSANVQSLNSAADYAAMRALLDLEAGTDFVGIGGGTYTGDISVPDEVYGVGWNGSLEAPTKNAVYDKIEAVAAGTLSDGDKGDITVSSSGAVWTIDAGVVTYAKMQSAASAGFIGATGAGSYSHRTYAQTRADLDLEAGVDFEAYASALSTGVVEVFIPAGAMTSRTTNGAGSSTAESATNKVMQVSKDFDQTTQEFVQFIWIPPKSWNLGTVTFIPVCIPAGSSGGWVFGMAGVAISNDDVIDAAFGTAQTSTDSFIAATDVHVGPECSAITIAGTPAAGDFVIFQINRTVADGSDTHNGDVKLLGIKLRYTINAKNDT
jgi:hypothetical protein